MLAQCNVNVDFASHILKRLFEQGADVLSYDNILYRLYIGGRFTGKAAEGTPLMLAHTIGDDTLIKVMYQMVLEKHKDNKKDGMRFGMCIKSWINQSNAVKKQVFQAGST